MHTLALRLRLATLVTIVATVTASAPMSAQPAARPSSDWPQWRGPNRDNLSTETGLLKGWDADGPAPVFQTKGLGAGFSSVAVTGNRIYTMGDHGGDQSVLALSAADGKLIWKTKVGPAWDDGYPGPRGTPTVDGDSIFVVGTEGDVVCVETSTGKERWRKSLTRDFGGDIMSDWKFSESPLVDGDRLIVTPGARGAALVALDKRTGTPVWKAAIPDLGTKGRDGAGYSSVVVSNGGGVKQYVQLLGRGVVGIRASDGAFLWGYNKVANHVANISTPAVRGDLVFASTGYQTGSALLKLSPDGAGKIKAEEVYFLEGKTFQNHHGGFVVVGNNIYAGHGHRGGLPICVELETGTVKWGGNIRNEGLGSAAITYADGHLYYRYENGMMLLIEATPEAYRQKGAFKLPTSDKPSWPYPVVSGGRLYVRDQDNLYVYDLRKA